MEKIRKEVINFKRRDFIEKRIRDYYDIQEYYGEEGIEESIEEYIKEIIDMHIQGLIEFTAQQLINDPSEYESKLKELDANVKYERIKDEYYAMLEEVLSEYR